MSESHSETRVLEYPFSTPPSRHLEQAISKLPFDEALKSYLASVSTAAQPEPQGAAAAAAAVAWGSSKGVVAHRALLGLHNGHAYIGPRTCLLLKKTDQPDEAARSQYRLDAAQAEGEGMLVPGAPISPRLGC